jgi:hypothetical protein
MIWLPIPNFPKYVVSDTGLVANVKNYKPLAVSLLVKNHTTYVRVTLFNNGTRYYKSVHRLVAEVFCLNPNNHPEVDHKDCNGENNCKDNLEWVTRSENISRSFARSPDIKMSICSSAGKKGGGVIRSKSELRCKLLLGDQFIKFVPGGVLHKDACVRYACLCGILRTVTVSSKEIRNHKGKCPICTGTVKRSSISLE